ncbi:nitroreductase family protein [Cerasicoccus arenae]|uniref:Nitroreductase domain-containing protein n=1 Tax=Cerasicoccus arenae TaxID=424488 RepID=A0A8J3D9U3_9BACT|nr:nitroreductase family protein [Cerasicoccus arenae]MBK1859000.1 nitroreductase family protein [Cerasicoccus arenae]GHB94610.1 hypothetical protein GCM10007047_07650 [Cerasicoccus arenae]
MKASDPANPVEHTIQARCTTKRLADSPLPAHGDRALVEAVITAAGWAPFHRPSANVHRSELASIVPWRCYALDAPECRQLRDRLQAARDTSKIPQLLATATALIQVTWLPNPPKAPNEQLFDPTLDNMEHLAAASSAVQNMLLAATARGVPNYWSSGGALREPNVFAMLGIPAGEILLGAIFLFPTKTDVAESVPGKLRDLRGPIDSWAKWTTLSDFA